MKVKKLLCILMSIILLASVASVAFSALASDCGNIPVIYIRGRGTDLYINPYSEDREQIYPLSYPDDYIMSKAKEILPVFAKAVLTNNYNEYCDALYNDVAPLFEKIVLDENGEVSNNSGIDWSWPSSPLRNRQNPDGSYDMFSYVFRYDWRIDPCEAADSLNDYVEAIKAVTGEEKVAIVSRCYATNVVMAYLVEYGHSDVDSCIFYVPTINGVVTCSQPFSGKLAIDGDAVDRYVREQLGGGTTNELIKATVNLFNKNYTIDLAGAAVEGVYRKVKDNIVPRLLTATYATMPSYWSMVGDEDYEDAKQLIFSQTDGKYDRLIEKLDNYHYNVQLVAEETLSRYSDEGLKVSVVSKYGYQAVPITEDSDSVTDDTMRLSDSTFGATCSRIDERLSDEYLSQSEANGTAKYISPDKQVDASTCLFPDNTWFVKMLPHTDFPDCVNPLLMAIVNYDGHMSVNDDGRYTQYLLYNMDEDTITPLTDEQENTSWWENSFTNAVVRFFKALFAFIKERIMAE